MRLVLLLLAGLAAAASASAQSAYVQQVTQYLDATRATLRNDGFERTRAYTTASSAEGGERTFAVPLQAGRAYVLAGACDNDCQDIDFWLYDAGDHLIDSDTAADDTPRVAVTPARSGAFRLKVRMQSCSSSPCAYGFGVFREEG